MSTTVTLVADVLVAALLAATICSSVALSRRITRLKADESAMRRTTGELVRATETAERAIAGLRSTLGDCDRTLAERLRTAERYAIDLATQVEAGGQVMTRIGQILEASRKVAPLREDATKDRHEAAPASPNGEALRTAAATAGALAERARRRLEGRAA